MDDMADSRMDMANGDVNGDNVRCIDITNLLK